jgi:WhiB family transcriptional regulator, redox-sensing transcriptional regulator
MQMIGQQPRQHEVVDLTWRTSGACRGLDPEIFYPSDEDEAAEAKGICNGCHVQVTCLEYALRFREKEGVWGGCTERERRRIVRQRRRTA